MRLWLGALLALTVLRLILAASLPLAPDEAYYFLWSRHLQPGYFDHPPMVAYWIRFGTALAGPTPLGVRLAGPLAAAAGSLCLWDAGEQLFPHRQAGVFAAALLNATIMVGAGAIVMTPDTPLLFFWTAGLAATARLISSQDNRWWLVIGVLAGLALLSKYTAVLFIAAIFIWLAAAPAGRAKLRGLWPWAALAIALAVFSPDIFWNATHGWASYLKQGSRVAGFDAARSGEFLLEFLAGQVALATPLVFGLAALGLWRLRNAPSPAGHLLLWLTIVPGVVLLEHVISGRVQSNWAAILYPSACLAAASLPMAMLRRWLKPAIECGFFLTALVYAQALAAPLPLPARADPTALQFSGYAALAAAAAARHPAFLTSDEYATTAILALYAPTSIPVVGFANVYAPRWWYFAGNQANFRGVTGILVSRRRDVACPVLLGSFTRRRGAQPVATYRFCAFAAPGAGLPLPRP